MSGHADWEDKNEIRLAEYFRIREKSDTLYRVAFADGTTVSKLADNLPPPEEMERLKMTVVDQRESARRQVEWFRLNGNRVMDREVLPGSWIPIVRCQGNARNMDGKIYRRGMVKSLMDPQRMVDYGEVAKIKRLGLPRSPRGWWRRAAERSSRNGTDANTKPMGCLPISR